MNDFVKQNKILITVVLSIVIGLIWSYVYFVILWHLRIHTQIDPVLILIFISIFIGLFLGKDLQERTILLIISSVCSVAMIYLFVFVQFIFFANLRI